MGTCNLWDTVSVLSLGSGYKYFATTSDIMIRKIIFIGVFLLSIVASNGTEDPCEECDETMTTPDVPITDPNQLTPKSTDSPCQACQKECNNCEHGIRCAYSHFCLGNCNCNPF